MLPRLLLVLIVGVIVFVGCSDEPAAPEMSGGGIGVVVSSDDWDEAEWRHCTPLSDSEIFLEFNSTDNDLGVQIFVDGEGWKRLRLHDPRGRRILDIDASRSLKQLGLTELRFESAEPSPGIVRDLFAEGEYKFAARSTMGERLFGRGELSFDLLEPAKFTPSGNVSVDPDNTVLQWNQVDGAEYYEIIVVNEGSGLEMLVQLPGDATSLKLPPEFMEKSANYKAEILGVADNGNKTITEGLFNTFN
jgi:hypothetical protein